MENRAKCFQWIEGGHLSKEFCKVHPSLHDIQKGGKSGKILSHKSDVQMYFNLRSQTGTYSYS